MKPIHKEPSGQGLLRALAALLFLAACAYMGAAFFGGLEDDMETVSAEKLSLRDTAELSGIALRREQVLCSPLEAELLAGEGRRLPAGGAAARLEDGSLVTAGESALFFTGLDGFEYLSPDSLGSLSPEGLRQLMAEEPRDYEGAFGRLVLGGDWYYAALCSQPLKLEPGPVTLLFEGREESLQAELMSLSHQGEETALLFRLRDGGAEYMSLRRTEAELLFGEYTGLRVPAEALHADEDGNEFVYTLTAGQPQRRTVEIIYKSGDFCLCALSPEAQSLKEGNQIITGSLGEGG